MRSYLHYKIIGLIFIVLALLSGCEIDNNRDGNGKVITQRRNAGTFDKVDVNGVLDVYVQQGDACRVEVVTDENLQDIVETKGQNGTLYVTTKTDVDYNATQMDIYITSPDFTSIRLDGVTSLHTVQTMNLENLELEKQNTGNVELDVVINKLTVNSYGVGNMELTGKGNEVVINNSMTGDISAFGFKVYNLNLDHSGTGNIDVFVTNNFTIKLSGVGDVYCKGNPVNIVNNGESVTGHLYIVD